MKYCIWYFSYLSPESQVFPPVHQVEPRPSPLDDDRAPQLTAASAPAPPPGTVTQCLSVWEQDSRVSDKRFEFDLFKIHQQPLLSSGIYLLLNISVKA